MDFLFNTSYNTYTNLERSFYMTTDNKLDLILSKISSLDEKVSSLDEKVSSLDEKVSSLDKRVSSLETGVKLLNEKVDVLDKRVTNIENDLSDVKHKITLVELTIENETNKNIRIVAENHLDLSRKLDDYSRGTNTVNGRLEIHDIFINKHENDIDKLVKQIARGA